MKVGVLCREGSFVVPRSYGGARGKFTVIIAGRGSTVSNQQDHTISQDDAGNVGSVVGNYSGAS